MSEGGREGGVLTVAAAGRIVAGLLGRRRLVGGSVRSGLLAGRTLAVGYSLAEGNPVGRRLAGCSSAGCSFGARAGLGSRRIGIVGCRGQTFYVELEMKFWN